MEITTYLGLDYGSKRIGVAFSDASGVFALPHSVVKNDSSALQSICNIAAEKKSRDIVLGESKNYKGEPNAIYAQSMEFKRLLEEKEMRVHLEPEFMTSAHTEKLQGKNDMTDASAAALILQSFLDKRKNQ
jgi:putative Holliday junction resolvase